MPSEKLAMAGKLAAGVAHTIRNPLTSVKMRLFSLERGLKLDPSQKEDFEVIAEEIGHIDTIMRNFLEFARPPKLTAQPVSLSDVVDTVLSLLKHRLESYNVDVTVERVRPLPAINADPEVRCVILRGAGDKAFAAGGDIEEFLVVRATVDDALHYHEGLVAAALDAIRACPVPRL